MWVVYTTPWIDLFWRKKTNSTTWQAQNWKKKNKFSFPKVIPEQKESSQRLQRPIEATENQQIKKKDSFPSPRLDFGDVQKNMHDFQKIFDRENFRDNDPSIVSKYSPCTHNLLLKKQICFSYPIPSNNKKNWAHLKSWNIDLL